jgi:hypothetical protein
MRVHDEEVPRRLVLLVVADCRRFELPSAVPQPGSLLMQRLTALQRLALAFCAFQRHQMHDRLAPLLLLVLLAAVPGTRTQALAPKPLASLSCDLGLVLGQV